MADFLRGFVTGVALVAIGYLLADWYAYRRSRAWSWWRSQR